MEPYRQDEQAKHFYIGTNDHVLCIDQRTGQTVWQTHLHSVLGSVLVNLLLHRGLIYATCSRMVACIDAASGQALWRTVDNKLAEPASLALDPTMPGGQLLVAAGGILFSFEAASGAKLWENKLPGLGYHPICVRAPGAVVAQPKIHYVTNNKTRVPQPLENDQYEAE